MDDKRYKDHVKKVRDGIKDEEEVQVNVVKKIGDSTFFNVNQAPASMKNSIRDLFKWYLFGAINEAEVKERLLRYNIDPSLLANNLWFKKILAEYFFGGTYKTLKMLIDSYQPKLGKRSEKP